MTLWIGVMFDPKNELLIFAEKDKIEEVAARVARVGFNVAGFNAFSIE